jgi:hypothetical protein
MPVPPHLPPAAPPPGPKPPGKSTLVGGFPWQPPAPDPATPPANESNLPTSGSSVPDVPGGDPPPPVLPSGPLQLRVSKPTGPAEDASLSTEELLWVSIRRRIAAALRHSPPATVSLAAHVLVVLALALWVVRKKAEDKVVLDLSFASEIVEAKDKGVQIKPTPEPVEEPQPEESKSEKPPVPDPIAAPPAAPEMTEAPGAAVAEASAPAVGSLLRGREEGSREALVKSFGGSNATEAAVARALDWLVRQQGKDGLWSLQGPYGDGGSQENRLAATAMSLLAFQGAGNTTTDGKHRRAVESGWKSLLAKQLPDGRFDVNPLPSHHSLYSHAQATIAICELYSMTQDEAFAAPARKAVSYAIAAQGSNGAWRYAPKADGDMSVTGWFLMALKSAEMAGIPVTPKAFSEIEKFLDLVAVQDGSRYGYRRDTLKQDAGPVTNAVCAEGLLARQYLGWPRNDKRLVSGVELLLSDKFLDYENDKDVYAWYYITQVTHHLGGEPWDRWNARMREVLPGEQVRGGREAGSWDPSLDRWGHIGGRLFTTCFCTYMLEVYYRHLPLYKHEAAGATTAAKAPPQVTQ